MSLSRLIFVLPSYGFDDFPEHLEAPVAENFLASWTAMWHPELLAKMKVLPEWKRADSSALDVDDALVVCPEASLAQVDTVLLERLNVQRNLFYESKGNRSQLLHHLAVTLNQSESTDFDDLSLLVAQSLDLAEPAPSLWGEASPITKVTVEDFFALGYASLQIQLLTHKARHSSSLNQPLFEEQVVNAAQAFVTGDAGESERWIQAAFDSLSEDRSQYHATSVSLLDLVFLNESISAKKLAAQLDSRHPFNVLGTIPALVSLQTDESGLFQQLVDRTEKQDVELVGTIENERNSQRLVPGSWVEELIAGKQKLKELGFPEPAVYGQLTSGMHADLPSQLVEAGYRGALLQAWFGGEYPTSSQAKLRWQASDSRCLDCIGGSIFNAADPNAFLALGAKIGKQLDYHQAPTILLARWPGQAHWIASDFFAVTRRCSVLGSWRTLTDYFDSTQRPYREEALPLAKFKSENHEADQQYARWILAGQKIHERLDLVQSMTVLSSQLQSVLKRPGKQTVSTSSETGENWRCERSIGDNAYLIRKPRGVAELRDRVDRFVQSIGLGDESNPAQELQDITTQTAKLSNNATAKIAALLTGETGVSETGNASETGGDFLLMVNPLSKSFRKRVELPAKCQLSNHVYDAADNEAVMDIPSIGFAVGGPSASNIARPKKLPLSALASGEMRNEFLEILVDPDTGSLKAVYLPQTRGNQYAGKLVMYDSSQNATTAGPYSQMHCRQLDARVSGLAASIRVNGELRFGNRAVAEFNLTYTLERGSRYIQIECELPSPSQIDWPNSDSEIQWQSAWANESTPRYYSHHKTRRTMQSTLSATPWIEFDEVDRKTFLLVESCEKHRVFDGRFMNSTWWSSGTQRNEDKCRKITIGVDLKSNPDFWSSSQELTMHQLVPKVPQVGQAAWFFRLNSRDAVAWLVANLHDDEDRLVGARFAVRDSSGQATTVSLECFTNVESAVRVNALNQRVSTLATGEDTVKIPLQANELVTIDVFWSK